MGHTRAPQTRRDGWTAERQLRFLGALADSRSVTAAAAAVGMSRESAYRLRNRSEGSLFVLLWDRALQADLPAPGESHSGALTDGRIERLLGNCYRREWGDFANAGAARRG